MRLGSGFLAPERVAGPAYDRAAQKAGMVHIGVGAFHRGHQAVYADDAMNAGDRDWGLVGVSMRSGDMAARLNPQDGLYTLVERDGAGEALRLIGSLGRVLVAAEAPDAVIATLASPNIHIVTLTITEKGYERNEAGADPAFCTLLAQAFERRRATGIGGLTLISCDNLLDNGARLTEVVGAALERTGPGLARWFRTECACPSTMVDRIVPSTTEADRMVVATRLGVRDEGAVVAEPFRQWVIEDRFAGPRPRWEAGGAQIVADVRPFEAAKLRMLNGSHSALAYLGLARGHDYVHQALVDPAIAPLVERLMRVEAAASLTGTAGLDTDAYADALLERFRNSALAHRLAQIGMDGSKKIPQRWLTVLAWAQGAGRPCPAILTALAAWMRFTRGDLGPVEDPMSGHLADLWRSAGQAGIATALFGPSGVFANHWTATPDDLAFLSARVRG